MSRILQNYAKWQLVFTLLPDLGSKFMDSHDTLQGMIGSESSYYTLVFNSARNTTYIMHIYFYRFAGQNSLQVLCAEGGVNFQARCCQSIS